MCKWLLPKPGHRNFEYRHKTYDFCPILRCRYDEATDNTQGAENTDKNSPGKSNKQIHKTKAELMKETSDTDSVNDPSSTDSEPPPSYEDACEGELTVTKPEQNREHDHMKEDEEFSERLI